MFFHLFEIERTVWSNMVNKATGEDWLRCAIFGRDLQAICRRRNMRVIVIAGFLTLAGLVAVFIAVHFAGETAPDALRDL
jgi:hypothetical protein